MRGNRPVFMEQRGAAYSAELLNSVRPCTLFNDKFFSPKNLLLLKTTDIRVRCSTSQAKCVNIHYRHGWRRFYAAAMFLREQKLTSKNWQGCQFLDIATRKPRLLLRLILTRLDPESAPVFAPTVYHCDCSNYKAIAVILFFTTKLPYKNLT